MDEGSLLEKKVGVKVNFHNIHVLAAIIIPLRQHMEAVMLIVW
jgi:hypothetical protein